MDEVQPGQVAEKAPAQTVRLALARLSQAAARGLNVQTRSNVLSPRILEGLYRQEPLLQRGIQKHSGDLVKLGFTVIKPGDEDEHPQDDLVQAWMRDQFVMATVREAIVASRIHGDGYVEIEWDDNGDANQPVQEGSIPVAVHLIDPVGVRFNEGDKDEDGEPILYLVQDLQKGGSVSLHPDRYHHFRFATLPGHIHGISAVETAFHAAISKVKGDQAMGEVLYSTGTPKVVATVRDGKQQDLEDVTAMLNDPNFVRGFVWDDRLVVNQLSPGGVNPTPFYMEFKSSIAAAIGLPVALLEGVQAGAVTGSETNLTDYHSDLRQTQVNVLEPFFVRVVAPLVGEEPKGFDLKWADPPVDPAAMASRVREQATAFTLLKDAGFTKEAAARIVGLDVEEDDFEEEPEVLPAITGPDGLPLPPVPPGPPGSPPKPVPPQATQKPAQRPAPAR